MEGGNSSLHPSVCSLLISKHYIKKKGISHQSGLNPSGSSIGYLPAQLVPLTCMTKRHIVIAIHIPVIETIHTIIVMVTKKKDCRKQYQLLGLHAALQPRLVVSHFHFHTEIQCAILEIPCVLAYVVSQCRVGDEFKETAGTTNTCIVCRFN